MSDTVQSLILAVIQGLTEFLPVSSSAHLILPAQLLGWADQGLAFDVAVHVGSLFAVLAYFRRDLWQLALGSWCWLRYREQANQALMVVWLIMATIPAGIAGLLLDGWVEQELRSVTVIAVATLVFGLLLGVADRVGRGVAELDSGRVLVIGLAQALAIIPGTSRSGITMTAGLLCGLSRDAAARFSFLMSIPIIAAAGLLKSMDLAAANVPVPWLNLALAAIVSGVTAYLCIGWFLRLLERIGFMPFVIYRCVLGCILLGFVWGGWV